MTYTWNGSHGRGALRVHREVKRAEAERRAAESAGHVHRCTSCLGVHNVRRECPPTLPQRLGRPFLRGAA